VRCRKT